MRLCLCLFLLVRISGLDIDKSGNMISTIDEHGSLAISAIDEQRRISHHNLYGNPGKYYIINVRKIKLYL